MFGYQPRTSRIAVGAAALISIASGCGSAEGPQGAAGQQGPQGIQGEPGLSGETPVRSVVVLPYYGGTYRALAAEWFPWTHTVYFTAERRLTGIQDLSFKFPLDITDYIDIAG